MVKVSELMVIEDLTKKWTFIDWIRAFFIVKIMRNRKGFENGN